MYIHRLIRVGFLVALIFGPFTNVFAQDVQRFSAFIDNLPIMEGVYEDTQNALVFDKPQGRLIQLDAISERRSPSEILRFYKAALPPLGWVLESDKRPKKQELFFFRANERLKIIVNQKDGLTYVEFALSPG